MGGGEGGHGAAQAFLQLRRGVREGGGGQEGEEERGQRQRGVAAHDLVTTRLDT